MQGFSGVLQADAYAGFNELYPRRPYKARSCVSPCPPKIHDVHVRTPSVPDGGGAETDRRAVSAIESEIRGEAEERVSGTKSALLPLLASLEGWPREKQQKTPLGTCRTGEGVPGMLLEPVAGADPYGAEDGWVEVDNNIAETPYDGSVWGEKPAVLRLGIGGGERGASLSGLWDVQIKRRGSGTLSALCN